MAVEHQHSDPEDPFLDLSAVSLFPRTLGVALHAEATTSAMQELNLVQSIFKSMALKGSTKLLEQAHVISKSYPDIQNLYSETENKVAIAISKDGKDRPQRRRPALGHKKAHFSLKPISSHSLPTIDFSANFDHIEDPIEHFLSFEQLEKLKQLRGEVAADLTQHQLFSTACKHPPRIIGKMDIYKDQFSVTTDMAEPNRLSREVSSERIIASSSNTSSVAESNIKLHPERTEEPDISGSEGINTKLFDASEREGSISDKEKTVDGHLEKLLSSFKYLDKGDEETLLGKRLQIQSIDSGKRHLAELDGFQLTQMPSTQTRTPLPVISALQRRISVKEQLQDINPRETSGLIDDGASVPVMGNGQRSSFKDKLQSPLLEADKTIHNTKPCSHENSIDHSSCRFDSHEYDGSTGVDECVEEEGNDKQPDALIFAQQDPEVEDLPTGFMNQYDTENLASSPTRKKGQTIISSGNNVDAGLFGLESILHEEVNVMVQRESISDAEVSKDNSSPSRANLSVYGRSKNLCILLDENDETQGLQEASEVSPNRGQKKRAPPRGQNKQKSTSKRHKSTSRRQSLAGVRHSTRIKSRPLDHWRGERFLYGRIHDSLATVIGLKYASPGKNAKAPVLKVKSFVSQKYADLVAQAASH